MEICDMCGGFSSALMPVTVVDEESGEEHLDMCPDCYEQQRHGEKVLYFDTDDCPVCHNYGGNEKPCPRCGL